MTIPVPSDYQTAPAWWTIAHQAGKALDGATGTVLFTPTMRATPFSTVTVLPAIVETPVKAGVMTRVDLTINDPESWNWKVTPRVGIPWEPFHVDITGPTNLATAAVTPGVGPVRTVKGETGASVVGAVDLENGKMRFELSNGLLTDPVGLLPGPKGPANVLHVGEVTKGDEPVVTITGTAPAQTLNVQLPKGDKGDRGDPGPAGTAELDEPEPGVWVTTEGVPTISIEQFEALAARVAALEEGAS